MSPSKGFKTILLYRVGNTLSYQIMMVAVGWHLYEITNSVVSLGLVGLAELVPYFYLPCTPDMQLITTPAKKLRL